MVPRIREVFKVCTKPDGTHDLTMVMDAVMDCLTENGDVTFIAFPVGTPRALCLGMLNWVRETTGLDLYWSSAVDEWMTDYVSAGDDFWFYEQDHEPWR